MVEVVAIPAAHIGSLKGSFALPRADMWGAACQLKLPIRPVEMQGFRSFWSGPAVLRRSMWQAFTGPGRFYKIYYLQHLILQRPRRHTHLHFPALSPSPSPPPHRFSYQSHLPFACGNLPTEPCSSCGAQVHRDIHPYGPHPEILQEESETPSFRNVVLIAWPRSLKKNPVEIVESRKNSLPAQFQHHGWPCCRASEIWVKSRQHCTQGP